MTELLRGEWGWRLDCAAAGNDVYDVVLLAMPAEQARTLLDRIPGLRRQVEAVAAQPLWSLRVELAKPLNVAFDAARFDHPQIQLLVREGSKPGRASGERWVVHTRPEWSRQRLDVDPSELTSTVLDALPVAAGAPLPEVVASSAHRWRYGRYSGALGVSCLWDREARVGVCGDWCSGTDIEAAFLSGAALAGRIVAELTLGSTRPSQHG